MPPSIRLATSPTAHSRQHEDGSVVDGSKANGSAVLGGSDPTRIRNTTASASFARSARSQASATPGQYARRRAAGTSNHPESGGVRAGTAGAVVARACKEGSSGDAAAGNNAASTSTAVVASSTAANDSMYSMSQMGGMGYGMMGGMYGYGGGYGMMGSPYGMGYGMMGGPLSGLNNFLFSFQSVVFSLGQAMQILGMNTQALHQLFNTGMSMFDHAVTTLNEMRALDISASSDNGLSEEEMKRRRRLRALRWSLVLGVSYAGFKLVRRWLIRRRELRGLITRGASGHAGDSRDAYGSSTHGYGPRYNDGRLGQFDTGHPSHVGSRYQSGYGNNMPMDGGYHGEGYGYSSSSPYGYGGRYSSPGRYDPGYPGY